MHEPFDFEGPLLKSRFISIVALSEVSVNCNDAENVGKKNFLNGICVEKAVIKKNIQVKILNDLFLGVNIQGKEINIDPTIFFTDLITLEESDNNTQDNFAFKFTHEPTALLKDGLLRMPLKSKLKYTS